MADKKSKNVTEQTVRFHQRGGRDWRFRCWDKKNHCFVKVGIGITLRGKVIAPAETYLKHNLLDMVLMQYTGLDDINGVGIFEGDIIRIARWGAYENVIGWVEYHKTDTTFFIPCTGAEPSYVNLSCCNENEIIGNVFENPDLLGVGKSDA